MGKFVEGGAQAQLTVSFGSREWALTRGRIGGILVCLLAGILGLIAEHRQDDLIEAHWDLVPLLGKVVYSVAFVILGLLIAPAVRSADHKKIASDSVERLYEMRRSTIVLSQTVGEALAEVEGETKLNLLRAHIELEAYPDVLLKTVADWEEVVPTVAADVSGRRANRQAILDAMEMSEGNG